MQKYLSDLEGKFRLNRGFKRHCFNIRRYFGCFIYMNHAHQRLGNNAELLIMS